MGQLMQWAALWVLWGDICISALLITTTGSLKCIYLLLLLQLGKSHCLAMGPAGKIAWCRYCVGRNYPRCSHTHTSIQQALWAWCDALLLPKQGWWHGYRADGQEKQGTTIPADVVVHFTFNPSRNICVHPVRWILWSITTNLLTFGGQTLGILTMTVQCWRRSSSLIFDLRAESAQFWPDAGNFTMHPHLWIFFSRPLLFLSSMLGKRRFFFSQFSKAANLFYD